MRLCAFWDCMEEVDEGMSFCKEHAKRLNYGLIDKCPKCGRYKDVRQKLCPDCNYGRPVAGWKISSRNLEEIDHQDLEKPDEKELEDTIPVYGAGLNQGQPVSRGEATCPSCGSPELTYKKAFDYFKCNNCATTFITPVYSYGEAPTVTQNKGLQDQPKVNPVLNPRHQPAPPPPRNEPEPPPQPPKPSPILGAPPPPRQEPPPIRQEPPQPVYREQPPAYQPPPAYQQQPVYHEPPPVRQEPPPSYLRQQPPVYQQPPQTWEEPVIPYIPPPPEPKQKEPFLDSARMQQMDDKTLTAKLFKMHGEKGSKIGWAYLALVMFIIALAAMLCWVFFNAQVTDFLDTL